MVINCYLFFIILGTLIVLLTYYLPDSNLPRNIESFENYDQFKLSFPDIEEVKSKVASQSYFNFFKELDAKARKIGFTFQDFQNKYSSSVLDFTENEKQGLQSFFKDIIEVIPEKHRTKLLLPEMKLAKVTGIENTYPHTHEDIIIFDKNYYTNFDNYQTLKSSKLLPFAKTLIHEIVHIKQRQSPSAFDELYRKWGFQSVSIQYLKDNIPKSIYNRIRVNPDELPYYRFWVWKNKVMPLVIYSSLDVTEIDQVMYVGLDWNDKTKKKYMSEWKEYIDYFGIEHNNYHPIEILAEYQSMYFMEVIGNPNTDESKNTQVYNSEGYKTYKTFFS